MCVCGILLFYMAGDDPGGLPWGLSTFLECIWSHLYSYLSYNAVCVEFSRGIKTAARRFKAAIHQRGGGGHVKVCDIHTRRY